MNPFRDIKDWSNVEQVENFLKTHDVNAKNEYGDTPLLLASEKGNTEVVKILIEHGAEVNTKDVFEKTPLNIASEKGHKEIVKILLESEAEVDFKDKYENTPLHYASYWGRTEIVQILISHWADVNAKNDDGRTPLNLASESAPLPEGLICERKKIVKILLNLPEIKLIEYKYKFDIEETLIKRKINMINKLKIIQTAWVGIEILEFIGGYLYPDISVGERLDIIYKMGYI